MASKLGEIGLTNLGFKAGGGLDAVKVRAEGAWNYCEACVEEKQSCKGGVFVCGFYKKMDKFVPV